MIVFRFIKGDGDGEDEKNEEQNGSWSSQLM